MDNLTIRLATSKDRQAVLDIADNIYGGRDYLPFFYDFFINNPNTTGYLATVEGNVVGFCVCHIVDDGVTCVLRAARVSPGYTGKGVYKALRRHIQHQHSYQTYCFSTGSYNTAIYSDTFKAENKLVLRRIVLTHTFHPNSCPQTDMNKLLTEGKVVDKNCLEAMFKSQNTRNYLFSQGRIVVSSVPYRTLISNVHQIFAADIHAFTDVRNSSDTCSTGLLTIMTPYPCKHPEFCCYLDVYGTDVQSLGLHLKYHLGILQNRFPGEVLLRLFVEQSVNTRTVLDILRQLDILKDNNQPMLYDHFVFQT